MDNSVIVLTQAKPSLSLTHGPISDRKILRITFEKKICDFIQYDSEVGETICFLGIYVSIFRLFYFILILVIRLVERNYRLWERFYLFVLFI